MDEGEEDTSLVGDVRRRRSGEAIFGFWLLIAVAAVAMELSVAATPVGPRILFDSLNHDFGLIEAGTLARHAFSFRNIGDDTLVIRDVSASCGCTASGAASNLVPPGARSEIVATFNSSGKRGKIHKTVSVFSNDSSSAVVTLSLEVEVVEPGAIPDTARLRVGKAMEEIARTAEAGIFDEECRSCHFTPASEKYGAELYVAVCSMCHGSIDHPSVPGAVPITGSAWLRGVSDDHIETAIVQGRTNPMMPSFAEEKGGPLSGTQVLSLLDWFREIRPQTPIETLPVFEP